MRRLAAFDIETTGIDPQSDRIVTAAVSLAGDARPTENHDWLVDRVGGPEGLIVVDPFVLDKQFDRYRRGKRTLGAVCEHYRVRLDAAHTANADAIAAARVAWRLAQAVAELRETELRALHGRQVLWAAEQAASLEQHFREQGNDELVERDWPIVTPTARLGADEPAAEPVAHQVHEQPTLFALAA